MEAGTVLFAIFRFKWVEIMCFSCIHGFLLIFILIVVMCRHFVFFLVIGI